MDGVESDVRKSVHSKAHIEHRRGPPGQVERSQIRSLRSLEMSDVRLDDKERTFDEQSRVRPSPADVGAGRRPARSGLDFKIQYGAADSQIGFFYAPEKGTARRQAC